MKEKTEIIENLSFEFTPEFEITESKSKGWLRIGGIALVEGESQNKNVYSIKNLKENDGKKFKWLFGHPSSPEEHIIGNGSLVLENGKLIHEGKIRNTSTHPDVVESIQDGFLGPSIHASAEKVERKDGRYFIEGLSIDGIGVVAFQGVKSASIDYAIAESFNKELNDVKESSEEDDKDKDKEEIIMSEEEIKNEQPEAPAEEPKEEPAEPAEEDIAEKLKVVQKELAEIKEAKKNELVESIVAINGKLKADELKKESVEKLELMKMYETKLSEKTDSVAVVETEEVKESKATFEEKDGTLSLTKEAYDKFNKEIRERVR